MMRDRLAALLRSEVDSSYSLPEHVALALADVLLAHGVVALAPDERVVMDRVEDPPLAERLAAAMRDAYAGEIGDPTNERTIKTAEWIIARLPFHGLALVRLDDGLTEQERTDAYRRWLHGAALDAGDVE